MKKTILLILLSMVGSMAHAEWGIGDKLCSDYVANGGNTNVNGPYIQWTFGYMTALSDYEEINSTNKYPWSQIAQNIDKHCVDSGMRYANAVRRAIYEVYRPAKAPRRPFER